MTDAKKILILSFLLILSSVLFMTLNVQGNWDFVLALRLKKWAALILVAYAMGVSTLLFQTLTNNPILTPSVLGFDTLYIFLQTLLVVTLGSLGYTQLPLMGKFFFEIIVMVGASLLLFQMLIRHGGRDLARMILIGVIFGVLFRSFSSLLKRMIDPEEFAVVQSNTFGSFNTINTDMLFIGGVIMLASVIILWRERFRLDVQLLGRNQVINLGIHYQKHTLWILMWIAVLVSVSTATVGPVSFFGLLACALANFLSASLKHSIRLPMVFLVAAILLVAGQAIFEHILNMKAVLGVVVEFAGGLVFLWLILRRKAI